MRVKRISKNVTRDSTVSGEPSLTRTKSATFAFLGCRHLRPHPLHDLCFRGFVTHTYTFKPHRLRCMNDKDRIKVLLHTALVQQRGLDQNVRPPSHVRQPLYLCRDASDDNGMDRRVHALPLSLVGEDGRGDVTRVECPVSPVRPVPARSNDGIAHRRIRFHDHACDRISREDDPPFARERLTDHTLPRSDPAGHADTQVSAVTWHTRPTGTRG